MSRREFEVRLALQRPPTEEECREMSTSRLLAILWRADALVANSLSRSGIAIFEADEDALGGTVVETRRRVEREVDRRLDLRRRLESLAQTLIDADCYCAHGCDSCASNRVKNDIGRALRDALDGEPDEEPEE